MYILKLNATRLVRIALFASTAFLISCNRDNEDTNISKPSIKNTEIGLRNSKIAYAGADLHFEAEIDAPGKIRSVEVEIHKDNGQGWSTNQIFKEFEEKVTAHIHKHIDIPANAELGEYHFVLTVTDQQGSYSVFGDYIKIQKNK